MLDVHIYQKEVEYDLIQYTVMIKYVLIKSNLLAQ